MKRLILIAGFLTTFIVSEIYAAEIRVRNANGEKEALVFSILKLVMSKSASDARFVEHHENLTEARMMREVEAGNMDVMWSGASPDKDEKLKAVRIPILKGLLGHRIFIIRSEDKQRFGQIGSLNELKALDAGQGTFWGDTRVLKHSGIPTITTIKYPNLFLMLEGGRFDYFPRAVHEPWVEVRKRPELNLAVDKNILLIYPFAMYFYVNKSNQALHDTIQRGFEIAIADGSFNELFFNHPMIRDVLEKANLSERKIFRIDNPFMHPETPYEREEFWLDIGQL